MASTERASDDRPACSSSRSETFVAAGLPVQLLLLGVLGEQPHRTCRVPAVISCCPK
ncbi:MAG: hypothetical protein MZW92_63730 [Comamonadaceae bacterium]|nr:hypothetical protein [Comamonadaceae bacterium]